VLGNGLYEAGNYADALPVHEAVVAAMRRLGESEHAILTAQGNLASTYSRLGRIEQALQIERDVYSGHLKLNGKESFETIIAANNCGSSLVELRRCEEAKPLLLKMIPVARRVLGDNDENTIRMRWNYAESIWRDAAATLDDLREAVATLEDIARTTRRVLGGAHPTTTDIERDLRNARVVLRARETPPNELDEVEDA
jgi:hypothetical protein